MFKWPPPAVPPAPEPAPEDDPVIPDVPDMDTAAADVPHEPNGHVLSLQRHREQQRDAGYRAMRPTADEIMRRLTKEAKRQADVDRIRREATDAGDAA